jgi:hypothetical protein
VHLCGYVYVCVVYVCVSSFVYECAFTHLPQVMASVEQQARGKKQLSFYKQPRTFSQKLKGFRREVTFLRIGAILQNAGVVLESGTEEDDSKE